LAQIEDHVVTTEPSLIRQVIADQMAEHPEHWQNYYSGTEQQIALQRTFSYSDRIRYYWANPDVSAAFTRLMANLAKQPLPETLVSQAFMGFDFGKIPTDATHLLEMHIQRCIERYFFAAGFRV